MTTDDNAVVDRGDIQTSLNGGTTVTITTGTAGGNSQAGEYHRHHAITKSAGGDASLSLKAHNNIAVNTNISSSSGTLNVTLWADSDNSGAGGISDDQRRDHHQRRQRHPRRRRRSRRRRGGGRQPTTAWT